MRSIPDHVEDNEPLHRRIHPLQRGKNGFPSSAAFADIEMSVDRGNYRKIDETMRGHDEHGLVSLLTRIAREHKQEVKKDSELLNPAHALVKGKKTKSIARRLSRASTWIIKLKDA